MNGFRYRVVVGMLWAVAAATLSPDAAKGSDAPATAPAIISVTPRDPQDTGADLYKATRFRIEGTSSTNISGQFQRPYTYYFAMIDHAWAKVENAIGSYGTTITANPVSTPSTITAVIVIPNTDAGSFAPIVRGLLTPTGSTTVPSTIATTIPAKHWRAMDNGAATQPTIMVPIGSVPPSGSTTPVPLASWVAETARFDFQGVTIGSPGRYPLTIQGAVSPSDTPTWTLDAPAGILGSTTTLSPTHTAPSRPHQGVLTLTGQSSGLSDKRTVEIYLDHLDRDYANFPIGTLCRGPNWHFNAYGTDVTIPDSWNCFGSCNHAYDGSGNGFAGSPSVAVGWAKDVKVDPTAADWGILAATMKRGDIVLFQWRFARDGTWKNKHANTCISATAGWGANNEPYPRPASSSELPRETWKWSQCDPKDYYTSIENCKANFSFDAIRVTVYHRPS